MRLLNRPWIFEIGADFYAWFNSNQLWRESCARLAAYFPPPQRGRKLRVLDLGCGHGVTAIALTQVRPDANLIGLDLATRMLEHARRHSVRVGLNTRINYVLADATALPFADRTLDVTTGHSFLYLVPDRAGVLHEAYRVLRSGGRYVSMEPRDGKFDASIIRDNWRNARFLISMFLWRPYSKAHGRFDEKNFPNALARAGFKNTGTELALGGLGIIGYGQKE